MDDPQRVAGIVASLLELLDEPARSGALRAMGQDAGSGLDALEAATAQILAADRSRRTLVEERTFQLDMVLDILSSRDRAAAEQAEWDFAADLQTAGLPQDFPAFPGRTDFDLHAGMITAKEVGGDLYDFFLLSEHRLGFVVADAAGKGLPAAIFITLARTLLRAAAERQPEPGACLDTVNAMLCIRNDAMMFATAFYGVLDTRSGEIHYSNAGHNPPYLLRCAPESSSAVETVAGARAPGLGMSDEARFRTQAIQLLPGDTLVCFSDGVTEATNDRKVLFGETRLVELLAANARLSPIELLVAIVAEVDAFTGLAPIADDMTLLVLRYNGSAGT
ncbi:MAG: PP2C family protein-serine/threonine phosphatase [Pseudomonadota bacterium]